MQTTRSGLKCSRRLCVIILPILFFMSSAAQGDTILSLAGNIGAAPIFNGSTDQWTIPFASLTNGSISDGTGYPNIWFIDNSTDLTWMGNPLNTDLNPGDPTQPADALFDGGGTLTITGKLYDATYNLLYDGLLLEGNVSGYRMTETGPDSNNIDLVENTAFVTVQDGFLMDNTLGVMNMPEGSKYWLDASFGKVEQDGGDLLNWQGGQYVSGTSTGISLAYWIPEPGSALLLLVGSMSLLIRRRNR
jgi:hypothetical protein